MCYLSGVRLTAEKTLLSTNFFNMFTGWILLLSVSLLTLLREANGAAAAMLVKLGDTVAIDFGDNVTAVETTALIVKDNNLTNFAQTEFGNRIKWHDGILTIKNIQSSDLTTFLYHLYDKPMAISLIEKR